jgi:hypothetical protein
MAVLLGSIGSQDRSGKWARWIGAAGLVAVPFLELSFILTGAP